MWALRDRAVTAALARARRRVARVRLVRVAFREVPVRRAVVVLRAVQGERVGVAAVDLVLPYVVPRDTGGVVVGIGVDGAAVGAAALVVLFVVPGQRARAGELDRRARCPLRAGA